MANHRKFATVMYDTTLGHLSASRIWRTVVFAGAMLAAPITVGCGGAHKAPASEAQTGGPADPAAADKAAADKTAADKAAADKAAADKAAADKAAADQAAADQAAADKTAADKATADEAAADQAAADEAAKKKKRPRGGGDRPTGRGFVLS